MQQTVESALKQTYSNYEICVSQNPQLNGPEKKIREWCEAQFKKGLIRYNLNTENLGLSGNLNKLTDMAKGEFVIFIGDDDLLHDEFLQTLAIAINNKTGVVFCNQYFIDDQGSVLNEMTVSLNKNYGRTVLKTGLINNPIATVLKNTVPLSASIIRRELAVKNPFFVELNTPELPFFLKIALEGYEFYYIEKQLAFYRIHSNSETAYGLTIDKLLKIVITTNVPKSSFYEKELFIKSKIIPAINLSLKRGDKSLAQFLLKSNFYPNNNWVKKILQNILLLLPNSINKQILGD